MLLEKRSLAYFIPNTFTALNMACGFIAILYAFHGEFYKACMFIVLGAIFDSVDGRIARLTNTQSSFGEQFDSLSDLVSFGVSPAIVSLIVFFEVPLSALLALWWLGQKPPIGIIPGIVLILIGCVLVVTRTRGVSND
jgi:phosphatidylserine synthase